MPDILSPAGRAGLGNIAARSLLLPPVNLYPERQELRSHWLDPVESVVRLAATTAAAPFLRLRLRRLTRKADRFGARMAALDDHALAETTKQLRHELRRHGLVDRMIPEAFAVIREHSHRVLGLRHHKVQLLGGLTILDGALAEMETGEGKTVTATLAAGTAAMAGIPVHIVTVNDYLAVRDAETMGSLFARLGLTVGTIQHGLSPDERRRAYACDIVYASNKEIVFDYLRDRVKLGGHPRNMHLKLHRFLGTGGTGDGLVMRGLHYAIVDEADSVLIDEARTPLILSRETDAAAERAWAEQAHRLGDELVEGRHYRIIRDERRIELTETGRKHLEELGERVGGAWLNRIRREQAVRQALTARILFTSGDQYLVQDGKVVIVDEYTGRIMAERSWNDGLHQLVEVKEGVEVTSRKEAIARMTYQRFFRRYRRLAGMTGTAREVRAELSAVYRLRVEPVPTNVPSRKIRLPVWICLTEADKWQRIVERAAALHAEGRPVLIGTRSVATSETVSQHLLTAGLAHDVLNAKDDGREAEIIAEAGKLGHITVATNMAGRGVDIVLGAGVAGAGGLHVILTERHDSKRIDRQLEGRTARRGEPGSTEAILSLEDSLLDLVERSYLKRLGGAGGLTGRFSATWLFRLAQRRAERHHSRARRILLDQDRRLSTILAFSGKPE